MALTLTKFESAFTKVQFSTKMRLQLYHKISSFLEQGIPLHDILEQLAKQYVKIKKGDIRAVVLKEWLAGLSAGRTFSTILSEWVPPAEAMLIRSGEKTGNLSDAFKNAIMITESSARMKATLMGQMSYPMVLLLLLFGLIYMFSTQAIPTLVEVKDPETWPPMSKRLYSLSMFVKHYWWTVIGGLGLYGLFAAYTIPRSTGSLRQILDKIPPWNVYKTFQGSVFLVSIAAMMKTGTPLVDSIKAIKTLSNDYVSDHLRRMILRMDGGRKVGESLNVGFFTKEMGMDIEIYGEVSDIQSAMDRIGKTSIEDGIASISKSATAVKNMVLVGVGTYVGWVYYAFFTLTQAIGADTGAQ